MIRQGSAVCRVLITLFILISTNSAIHADSYFRSDSVRSLSVGGSSLFLDGELLSILRNPAGFLDTEPLRAITEVSFYAAGPVRDVAAVVAESIYGDGSAVLASPAVQAILDNVYADLGIVGPVGIGIIGDGIALGIYSDSDFLVRESNPLTLNLRIRENLGIAGGFSFRLPFPESVPGRMYGGLVVKGMVAGEFEQFASYLQIPGVMASIANNALAEFPFSMITGFGLNFGVEYRNAERLSIRVMAEDLISGVRIFAYDTYSGFTNGVLPSDPIYETLPLQLHAGASYNPPLGRMLRYISDLTLYLEYADMLDFLTRPSDASNPVLHVVMGLDCEIMEIIHIRGGVGQGLLSTGLGVDFSGLSMNVSVFGRELGTQPGTRPVFGAAAGISVRR